MNKKFEQIAADCGLYIDPHNLQVTMREVEFFAEQIVKRCVQICNQTESISASSKIQNEFGVRLD